MTTALVDGPAWASHRVDLRAGRFPLGVEAHLMQMTAHLVPGVTTVTINARYYALHGFVAAAARQDGLDEQQTLDLVRRCEVVVAAATLANADPGERFGPHGADVIEPRLREGPIELASVSSPGGYSGNQAGFLSTYIGSELELGIIAGPGIAPGLRCDEVALRRGFDGIIELANSEYLDISGLRGGAAHLSMHAARDAADGRWLAGLLCADDLDDHRVSDQTRRNTISLLGRALDLHPSLSVEESFHAAICYGPELRLDPIIDSIEEAAPWRGTMLRRHSVNAWRQLWAWLVGEIGSGLDAIDGHTSPEELAEAAVAQCPAVSVRSYLKDLPPPFDAAGDPLPAEVVVGEQDRTEFDSNLGVLVLGGERFLRLEGATLRAFVGQQSAILDPTWVNNRVQESLDRPLHDFVSDLVRDVLDRSQRIASQRAFLQSDGTYVRPGRVHEHAGKLWKTSDEGRGNVGLRLEQLGRILTSLGVLESVDDALRLTGAGRLLLA